MLIGFLVGAAVGFGCGLLGFLLGMAFTAYIVGGPPEGQATTAENDLRDHLRGKGFL